MAEDAGAVARRVFAEVHTDLPREAPGSRESTDRALAAVTGLAEAPAVLDIGCGPGTQTLDLARALPNATITAVDNHERFVAVARTRVREAGLDGRVRIQTGDMRSLDWPDHSFDLLWCEGAIYIMGVGEALRAWRYLLKPGGWIGFTDAVWLTDAPPEALKAWWADGYPGMLGVEESLTRVSAGGFEVREHFLLPESAWWDHYYAPMEARLAMLRNRHRADPVALAAVAEHQREVDYYRRWSAHYGYLFVVASKSER